MVGWGISSFLARYKMQRGCQTRHTTTTLGLRSPCRTPNRNFARLTSWKAGGAKVELIPGPANGSIRDEDRLVWITVGCGGRPSGWPYFDIGWAREKMRFVPRSAAQTCRLHGISVGASMCVERAEGVNLGELG